MENQKPLPEGILLDEFGSLSAKEDYKGIYIHISPNEEISRANKNLTIAAIVGVFVNPGAAMSTWQDFPQNIIIHVKDLSTSKTYESRYLERSVSWAGTPDFGPTNQVVHNTFDENLFSPYFFMDVEFLSDVLKPETYIEVYATFKGMTSNTIKINIK